MKQDKKFTIIYKYILVKAYFLLELLEEMAGIHRGTVQ